MAKKKVSLFPKQKDSLEILGENIRLARLRRNFTAEVVAERAGISPKTYQRIEQGNPGISIGHLQKVLSVLGQAKDLQNVALDDELGRRLQDLDLTTRGKATKRT